MSSLKTPHHHPTPWRELYCSRFFCLAQKSVKENAIGTKTGIASYGAARYTARLQRRSAIAQLVEQSAVNRPVVGSSPTRGAIITLLHPQDHHVQLEGFELHRRFVLHDPKGAPFHVRPGQK